MEHAFFTHHFGLSFFQFFPPLISPKYFVRRQCIALKQNEKVSAVYHDARVRRDFVQKNGSRKARELAKIDENRRASGKLNPQRDKNERTYRRGEGTTPVTTACVKPLTS